MLEVLEPKSEITKFTPTDGAIAAMSEAYMPLVIRDANDAEGYKAVHSARMVVKDHRVKVEKVRKQLKADALEYGRKVDAEAKRITAMLEPIELHLESEETRYNAEKDRIKNAARLAAEAEAKAKAEAEAARLEAERQVELERMQVEREKLEAERRAIEEERARQRAAQDKIDAERRALEMERAKAEAAERARIETEARLDRKAKAEEAARQRAEALRPDREKLLEVANAVLDIPAPDVSPAAIPARKRIGLVLKQAVEQIRAIVDEMVL